jgi:dienelactone hydrolase
VAYAEELGSDEIREQARRIADGLGNALVYAGFLLGVELAQMLAQTRPGARGMLMFDGCVRPAEFGTPWPSGVPVQIHGMENDPYFVGYELDPARELIASTEDAELFLYPGDRHLFADSSLPWYDADAAALLTERVLGSSPTEEFPGDPDRYERWLTGRSAACSCRATVASRRRHDDEPAGASLAVQISHAGIAARPPASSTAWVKSPLPAA